MNIYSTAKRFHKSVLGENCPSDEVIENVSECEKALSELGIEKGSI